MAYLLFNQKLFYLIHQDMAGIGGFTAAGAFELSLNVCHCKPCMINQTSDVENLVDVGVGARGRFMQLRTHFFYRRNKVKSKIKFTSYWVVFPYSWKDCSRIY